MKAKRLVQHDTGSRVLTNRDFLAPPAGIEPGKASREAQIRTSPGTEWREFLVGLSRATRSRGTPSASRAFHGGGPSGTRR
jgi:hypothetical protein